MNPILKRLDEIADDPLDPALGIAYSERQASQRARFCGTLRTVLNALHAYHPHDSGRSPNRTGDAE